MSRLLYDLEDYLEDAAADEHLPHLLRRIAASLSRTLGEAGALLAAHRAEY
jgi:hypothetical protein